MSTKELVERTSDTPRTDAYYETYNSWMAYAAKHPNMPPEQAECCPIEQSPEDFARQLERELLANGAHWPDNFDCGFKHALGIARLHSSLPAALDAMERECEVFSACPSDTECPYCGVRLKNGQRQPAAPPVERDDSKGENRE